MSTGGGQSNPRGAPTGAERLGAAALMEQIRAGVTLKPTVVNPRPVFPADPPPPIPVQIMVGEIVAPSPPDVRPALDRLEATLRRVAADIGRSKLNGDIVSVPSIMRALLGGPPLLDTARQEAAWRDIQSAELDKLRVLKPSSDMHGILGKAFRAWELAESDLVGFSRTGPG